MRCRTAQELVIAAADGELSGWRRRSLERHLAGCDPCRAERAGTERLLEALDAMPLDAMVPARLEQEVLRRMRHEAAASSESRAARAWFRPAVSLVATGAVATIALVSLRGSDLPVSRAGKPAAMEVARGTAPATPDVVTDGHRPIPDDPPPALAARPDLFVDLSIVRNLDKLKHFDAIATTDVDDGTAPGGEGAPTNG